MTGDAPGWPGIEPRWTSSAKEAVGSSRSVGSPIWFSLSHGVLNEVYYPRIDQACLRDAEFLVVDGRGGFFEEKRDAVRTVEAVEPGVPAFLVRTAHPSGAFVLTKRFATDPRRPTLLIDLSFASAAQQLDEYALVFLAAPHLANHGSGNTAWVGEYKGTPAVFGSRGDVAMAIACSAPLSAASVGFVGFSDAWQQLRSAQSLEPQWQRAADGNVAVAIQPDLVSTGGTLTVAMGFGTTEAEAGHHALASLQEGFESCLARYTAEWRAWQRTLQLPGPEDDTLARTSGTVLAVHEARTFPGGVIASLSIPWGFSRGDGELGGYHLVWPRDHAEAAGAFFAIGAVDDGVRALAFLRTTQEHDGHWAQNMWLDGRPYWQGVQLDETALPILLAGLAVDMGALGSIEPYWPMVRRAAEYLVTNGPVTAQDRWEEDGGYSPFTLAAVIAALLTAATMADTFGEADVGRYLRETADCWDVHIERWCYVSGTTLAGSIGVDGYYVRIGPPEFESVSTVAPIDGWVPIKNRPPGQDTAPASSIVSPDALALVRFGLRAADDPRILSTIEVIDATLRHEFPFGSGWRRYTDDGYGEHDDGSPFDGTGRGRVWPLLTGERGHYAVARGDLAEARRHAATLRAMAGAGGLLPEQTWDSGDLPDRELWHGRPSGSAMPLVWAHAEYLKLLRSIDDGAVFDMPSAVRSRTIDHEARRRRFWRRNHMIRRVEKGSTLRIELLAPATLHWTHDNWVTTTDTPTRDTEVGLHIVDLDLRQLRSGTELVFTMNWGDRWEGSDHRVTVS